MIGIVLVYSIPLYSSLFASSIFHYSLVGANTTAFKNGVGAPAPGSPVRSTFYDLDYSIPLYSSLLNVYIYIYIYISYSK